MSDHKRNTEGLKQYIKQKSELTAQKVDNAIKKLVREKQKINFNTVSVVSGISKAYLYTHSNIRERIESLRNQQQALFDVKVSKHQMTDNSKDVLLAAKNKRIKLLEDENKRLKQELQYLRGKIYESKYTL